MFKNYLITALRNIRRQRLSSVINIGGLAVGMASFILILLYIKDELSYDRHWKDSHQVYRIGESIDYGDRDADYAVSPFPLAPSLKAYFPEIELATRISAASEYTPVNRNGQIFNIPHVHYADTNFFKVFNYRFVEGTPDALDQPNHVVLSLPTARKLFGEGSASGREIQIGSRSFQVAGVIDYSGSRSHLQPNILRSSLLFGGDYLKKLNGDWTYIGFYTYLKFRDQKGLEAFHDKLGEWHQATIQPWLEHHDLTYVIDFKTEPLQRIHFLTGYDYDMASNTDIKYIYIFGYVAAFILLIVSINYINLSTAKSANRANEVGIRKTMGAQKKHLVRQFLGESVMISLLAMVLGIILVELLLPVFNQLVDKDLTFTAQMAGASGLDTLVIVLSVTFLIGLISGIFPAFVLSRYRALRIAGKNFWNMQKSKTGPLSLNLRKVLVVFQFMVTVSMIVATLVVFTQMHFMRSRDLGFDKERVVVIDIPADRNIRQQLDAIQTEMKKVPGVTDVSASVDFPGYKNSRLTFYIDEEGKYRQEMINMYRVDDRFADILGIDVVEGRFFSKDHPSDPASAFVINEAAKEIFGENPVGQKMACGLGVKGQIVGVTSNFNYSSLHNPIEPLVYLYKPGEARYLGLKIGAGNIPGTLKNIQAAWKNFDSPHPYAYRFLDAQFDSQYKREEKMVRIFGYFSILTILLACLGLFGLSAFMAERRRKEIGIRKVMGSNAGLILRSFLKDYTLWVLLANVIAWPLVYYLMERWLQNFAYRTPIPYYLFVAAAGVTLLLATATVSYHAWKAANTNPADVLRDE